MANEELRCHVNQSPSCRNGLGAYVGGCTPENQAPMLANMLPQDMFPQAGWSGFLLRKAAKLRTSKGLACRFHQTVI